MLTRAEAREVLVRCMSSEESDNPAVNSAMQKLAHVLGGSTKGEIAA